MARRPQQPQGADSPDASGRDLLGQPLPAGAQAGQQANNRPEFTVSELSGAIKRALEDGFGYVRLRGEISGYRGPHSSGHCYFGLKDDKSKIDAVIWKGTFGRLRFRPEEGMDVIAQGKITTFPGSSKYQIVIETLEPAGVGALMAMLDERKRRFAAEGLFDEGRKKPRPFLPTTVGIVTSPTGAVIRDMLAGFAERCPTRVVIWPVRVQGEGSAAEIAAAIRGFNALEVGGLVPRPDVLIVARGGGSLEDLWSFNDEAVVRAAAESRIPLISAVGHETDWTLIDLVADARAPTPTKAAEWAVPKYADLVQNLEALDARHRVGMRRVFEQARTALKAVARGLPRLSELTAMPRQRFDEADRRLAQALLANTRARGLALTRTAARLTPSTLNHRVRFGRERLMTLHRRAGQAVGNAIAAQRRLLDGRAQLLAALSYHGVLARGFVLVRGESGGAVRTVAAARKHSRLTLEFHDGQVSAVIPDTSPAAPSGGRGGQAPDAGRGTAPDVAADVPTGFKPARRPGGDQGSLF